MGQDLSAHSEVYHGCYKAYKYKYTWIIPDFKDLATKTIFGSNTTNQSLNLNIQGKTTSFDLILFATGYNERAKDYVSVYLKKNSTDEMLIQFTCAVLDGNRKEINAKSIKQKMSLESYLGWITYCRGDFLLDKKTKILINGNLHLNCTLEIFEKEALMNAETEDFDPCMNRSLSEISENLNHLLLKGDFSDATLNVRGKKFPVHKAILSARSTVFKAMFKSQLQVNSNEIHISDIKAETVNEMLHYIYSGDVGYIDVKTVQELYYAADKYELFCLKNICNKILVGNMDTNNAIDTLLLGHKHSDYNLRHSAIEFIARNASEIQEKKEWMLLMKSYSELANMVFKFLSKEF